MCQRYWLIVDALTQHSLKYPYVFAKLIARLREYSSNGERKYNEAAIKDIVQGIAMKNIMRVWRGVEAQAAKLQLETEPAWSWVPIDEVPDQTCVSSRQSGM